MPIPISCSSCGRKYQARDEQAGKTAKCQCGQRLPIPSPSIPVASLVDEKDHFSPVADPFADIPQDLGAQGTKLPPLAGTRKKHSKQKQGSSALLFALLGGGAVVILLIVGMIVISVGGSDSDATMVGDASSSASNATGPVVRWSTPEEVFEAQKKAVAEKDWKTLYELYTPTSQEMIVSALGFMTVSLAQLSPDFKTLSTEYGIDDVKIDMSEAMRATTKAQAESFMKKQMAKMKGKITDKPGFFVKIMGTLTNENVADPTGQFAMIREQIMAQKDARLTNLKIEGDTASATSVGEVQGQSKQEPLRFVKIDGQWRIEDVEMQSL